jgi:thiol-disulfide isomerase/thioredoxin
LHFLRLGLIHSTVAEFEELAAQYPNAVFLKVDVDAEADIAQAQNVEAMPTFKFFQNGKVVQEVVGADINAIIAACAKYCA